MTDYQPLSDMIEWLPGPLCQCVLSVTTILCHGLCLSNGFYQTIGLVVSVSLRDPVLLDGSPASRTRSTGNPVL
jgi:hypothetical protein